LVRQIKFLITIILYQPNHTGIAMKTLFCLLTVYFSFPLLSAHIDLYKAILDSSHVQNTIKENDNLSIQSIEVIASYRCPGCYDFLVCFKDQDNVFWQQVLQTEIYLLTDEIKVKEILGLKIFPYATSKTFIPMSKESNISMTNGN
jgi:hypothetical protein